MMRLNEEQKALATRYRPLAVSLANRLTGDNDDDAVQEACLALCDAASSWDKSKSIFHKWAKEKIRWRLLIWIKALGPYRKRWQPLTESVLDASDKIAQADDRNETDWLLSLTTRRRRIAIRAYYMDGLNDEESGAKLGISRFYAHRLRHEGLAQIRRHTAGIQE